VFSRVVGKLVVGEHHSRNNVGSHMKSLSGWMRVAGLRLHVQ
jgi:hypothetical protein